MASEFSSSASYTNRQRAALERALGELRIVLSEDDNWRALAALQSVGEAAGGAVGKAWLARQQELQSALDPNPVYRLYREMEEALFALDRETAKPASAETINLFVNDSEESSAPHLKSRHDFFSTGLGARIAALDEELNGTNENQAEVTNEFVEPTSPDEATEPPSAANEGSEEEAPSEDSTAEPAAEFQSDPVEIDAGAPEPTYETAPEEPVEKIDDTGESDLVSTAALSILASIEPIETEANEAVSASPELNTAHKEGPLAVASEPLAPIESSAPVLPEVPAFELVAEDEVLSDDPAEIPVEAIRPALNDERSGQEELSLEAPETADEDIEIAEPAPEPLPGEAAAETIAAEIEAAETDQPVDLEQPLLDAGSLLDGQSAEIEELEFADLNDLDEPIEIETFTPVDDQTPEPQPVEEPAALAAMEEPEHEPFVGPSNDPEPLPIEPQAQSSQPDPMTAQEDEWLQRLRARRAQARRDTEAMRDQLLQADRSHDPSLGPAPVPPTPAEAPRTFIRVRPETIAPVEDDEAEVKIVVRNSATPVVAAKRSLEHAPKFTPRYTKTRTKNSPAPGDFDEFIEEASVEIIRKDR